MENQESKVRCNLCKAEGCCVENIKHNKGCKLGEPIKEFPDLQKENEHLKQMYKELYDNTRFIVFPSDKCLKHFHFYNKLKSE